MTAAPRVPTAADAVRLVIDNEVPAPELAAAREAAPPEPPPPDPPPRDEPPDDGGPERRGRERLPDGFPVTPLGKTPGVFHFLDANGQYRAVPSRGFSRTDILDLVGVHEQLLYRHWPRVKEGKDGVAITTGWRPELAQEALAGACAAAGILDVANRLRGPGGWRGDDGELVMHCGDRVYVASSDGRTAIHQPGALGRAIYPAAPRLPHPVEDRVPAGAAGPGETLRALLDTWTWRRPGMDGRLALGWIGCAIMGAALKWRPVVWVTGDKATGKSTFQDVLKAVLGHGLLAAADASAAGIWQSVGFGTQAVWLDEAEADQDNRRVDAVVKLARVAASGNLVLRGGAEHKGIAFQARNVFGFGSILVPPLRAQDRSRICILELMRRDGGGTLAIDERKLGEIGAALRRRLLQEWARWPGLLQRWRDGLAGDPDAPAIDARTLDVYAPLLAAADLVLHDTEPTADELAEWAARLAGEHAARRDEEKADHERCVQHLLTLTLDLGRSSAREACGELVRRAIGRQTGADPDQEAGAARALQTFGLKVIQRQGADGAWAWHLAIANDHVALARLFEGTHWAARAGTTGVWVQSLRRVPGAAAWNTRFAGVASRCTLIPLDPILPPGGEPDDGAGDALAL